MCCLLFQFIIVTKKYEKVIVTGQIPPKQMMQRKIVYICSGKIQFIVFFRCLYQHPLLKNYKYPSNTQQRSAVALVDSCSGFLVSFKILNSKKAETKKILMHSSMPVKQLYAKLNMYQDDVGPQVTFVTRQFGYV